MDAEVLWRERAAIPVSVADIQGSGVWSLPCVFRHSSEWRCTSAQMSFLLLLPTSSTAPRFPGSFWVDTADKQPCIGTGGMLAWKLKAYGKIFHSGLPHKVGG